jgi:UDP-2,3-diacylglucosamine hydrolase
VTVADAHLGAVPSAVTEAFLAFVERVPELGDALLINGDLFDFWFCYRHVAPRHGFHVAAALARVRRRVKIAIVGGNHDRWSDTFWQREVGALYDPGELRFHVGRRHALAVHGDGLTDTRRASRMLNSILSNRTAIATFRLLHPDLAYPLVRMLTPFLGDETRDADALLAAVRRQEKWARRRLTVPDVDLVIMAHTHQAAAILVSPGRHYLNPGAWFDGFKYAVATEDNVELRVFAP